MGLEQSTYLEIDKKGLIGDKPGERPPPLIKSETFKNKIDQAVELLQAWEPVDGYYLADSGGKDSCVARDLLIKAKVKFDAHYCVSPIDPKPVQDFLKQYHPDTQWDYHAKNFWKMVVDKGLPLRKKRWCCEVIKENGGIGRLVVVGNRRAEGGRRKNQCYIELSSKKKNDITYIRPIIDFGDKDVWEYIRENNVPYCDLYDIGANKKGYGEGIFKRLGCVMCPFSSNPLLEVEYNPKIAHLWRRACDQIIEVSKANGYKIKKGVDIYNKYETGQEMWDWWIDRSGKKINKNQVSMF